MSLNKAEYQNFEGLISDYYKHVLMNPNTLLAPVLGIYVLEITLNSETIPLYLIMMRDV